MRRSLLVLAVALTVGATHARADLVSYNMTGTITAVDVDTGLNHPLLAVGDHITWTLQYDPSLPRGFSGNAAAPSSYNYHPSTNLITRIVDQTTGSSLPLPPVSATTGVSSLQLFNHPPGFFAATDQSATKTSWGKLYSSDSLSMYSNNLLPTFNLADLQLNTVPFALGSTSFGGNSSDLGYYYNTNSGYDHPNALFAFEASVDSISGPMAGTPEPGSLTLCLLGAAGLATRRIRRRCPR